MKSPVSILGFIVLAIGWLLLLFGSGVDAGFNGRQVANLHSMYIAMSAILTGGFLTVVGTLDANAKASSAVAVAAVELPSTPSDGKIIDPQELEARLKVARERAGV